MSNGKPGLMAMPFMTYSGQVVVGQSNLYIKFPESIPIIGQKGEYNYQNAIPGRFASRIISEWDVRIKLARTESKVPFVYLRVRQTNS
jgi:hypothetical protein